MTRRGAQCFPRAQGVANLRHCEERSDEAIQGPHGFRKPPGLLRGACHRAGHFGPDPLARNDALPRSQTRRRVRAVQACHVKREDRRGNGNPRGGASVSLFATPASPGFVARIEQSEIRERSLSFNSAPGFRYAQSGLQINKGCGTPANAVQQPPHLAMRLCPLWRGAARLTAFHRGSRQRESSSLRLSFRPGFLGRGLYGRYPPSPVPVQRAPRAPVIMPGD